MAVFQVMLGNVDHSHAGPGNRTTSYVLHEDSVLEAAVHVQRTWYRTETVNTAADGMACITVAGHSSAAPAWVSADSPALAAVLGEFYGCPIVEHDPDVWAAAFTDTTDSVSDDALEG